MHGDGDGWVLCGDGQQRWGRHGAAGLLLRAPGPDPADPLLLLQLRVGWSHHGGTWGIPGGARDSDETAAAAALREAAEETGIDPGVVDVRGEVVDDLGGDPSGWTYTTVVADVAAALGTVLDRESDALQWVAESQVGDRTLHPGFGASWPALRARPVQLVVDVANVVGTVPDGWWRDRPGASTRVLTGLAAALPRTVRSGAGGPGFSRVTGAVVVLEGAARSAGDVPGLTVVRAPGAGDDAVVEVAGRVTDSGAVPVVVSADRGLLARLPGATASLAPSMLRSWLD